MQSRLLEELHTNSQTIEIDCCKCHGTELCISLLKLNHILLTDIILTQTGLGRLSEITDLACLGLLQVSPCLHLPCLLLLQGP